MATQVAQPLPNVDYALSIGPSFAPEAGEEVETSYAALRYDFRPASADVEQPGVLLLGKDNRVSLYLANSATCEWDVLLAGKYEPYSNGGQPSLTAQGRDCLDCVALFDPATGTFRLETLLGQYNTKHIRDAPAYRTPADDYTEHSPGTSGSAGPGPSKSPTGVLQSQPPQPQRRGDSPVGSEDGGVPAGAQRPGGQPHDRQNGGAVAAASGGTAGGVAGVGGSKPPRPPGAGRSGGAAAGGGGGAQGGGGGAGKKRQRDGGAAGGGGGGQSPAGVPARKTSRLARASGPQSRSLEQPRKGSGRGKAAPAVQPTTTDAAKQQQRQPAGGSQERPRDHGAPAASAEDDVDAELLDAFDTFDADLDEEPGGGGGGEEEVAVGGDGDDGGAGDAGGEAEEVADGAEADADGDDAAGAPVDDLEAPPVVPVAAAAVAVYAAMAVTPTLEVEQEEEEVGGEEEEEMEEAAPSPPRARLVVEMMDDDEGYGYGAEEEDGLGIEYF